ncbi:Gfo/Idh/MocA family protein [uncultured Pseudokineococcus sp.]|uniref:Gfo/Idh/MocA family protein n=1 Tax=uncultured Pseudokineococcus sp. TaxID=1642928 RepID=UPI00261AE3B8|nr:Gfo/Idh/MocA family oxidoreductase [uncultured Pseudokineococcus sp.]
MNGRTYRIAIIGAGVIGKQHGKLVSELDRLELVAVADHDVERARELTDLRGGAPFRDVAEVLAATDVDVVAVCTPTGAHGEVAVAALDAGKHVVIEKPAEVTLERIDEIIAAQQRAGTLVTVISQHRFDRSTEIVADAIAGGRLGRLTSGIASIDWWRGQSYYDSGQWRGTWELDGGGALMNQGVHTVDLLVAALGEPVEVFAYTGLLAHEGIEVEDVAVGVVRFASGALGVLHGSTAAFPGMSARLQVHGDRGSAVIDDDRLVYIHESSSEEPGEDRAYGANGDDSTNQVSRYAEQGPSGPTAGSDPGAMSDAHRHQYENVLAALDGDEELRVTLQDNRRSVSVILGVYESARTGRPVRLGVGSGAS